MAHADTMKAATATIKATWDTLTASLSAPRKIKEQVFQELIAAYQQSHRHYHTLQHIAHVLSLLQQAGIQAPHVLWAALYHDAVYVPHRSDNERRSADMARRGMTQLQVPDTLSARTCMLIEATTQHLALPHMTDSEKALLDADMAILGSCPEEYEAYCQAVRREFKWLPTFIYERGRRKFLTELLERERIFNCDWFYERFEAQARSNMADRPSSSPL